MVVVAGPPTAGDVLAELTDRVEGRLRAVLDLEERRWSTPDPWGAEPVALLRSVALAGGKRLRPAFCWLGYLGAGGDPTDPAALDAAVALELLHTFALIHDDVMDGSAVRRGAASLHRRLEAAHQSGGWTGESRRYGEGLAVLVGDLAFAWADHLLAPAPTEARAVWTDLRLELVMGQYLDLAGTARGGVGCRRAVRIARLKSGSYTVERPLQLGAAMAGGLALRAEDYVRFARPLGEAFQLRDDVLGAFGDAAVTGKPVGDDLRQGKPTVLLELTRERCPGSPVLERVGAADLSHREVGAVRHLMMITGAVEAVEAMITARRVEAVTALETMDIPVEVAVALRHLSDLCAGEPAR